MTEMAAGLNWFGTQSLGAGQSFYGMPFNSDALTSLFQGGTSSLMPTNAGDFVNSLGIGGDAGSFLTNYLSDAGLDFQAGGTPSWSNIDSIDDLISMLGLDDIITKYQEFLPDFVDADFMRDYFTRSPDVMQSIAQGSASSLYNGAGFNGASYTGGPSGSIDRGTVNRSGGGDWMDIAYSKVGQREIPGSATNDFISACHATTTLGRANDDVPWCSSFVNWVMEQAGYEGTNNAMAISWADWGNRVGSLDQAQTGDIVVLKGPESHHVGFLVRAADGSVTLLGGNQSNQVKESTFNLGTYDIVAIRRPPAQAV